MLPEVPTVTDDQASAEYLDLYSRQIGAYGLDLMGRLSKLHVLICGLNGIGVETAKNLILAGPKQVTLFDPNPAGIRDQQTNFYISDADIQSGTSRAQACLQKLATLNPYVNVKTHDGPITSALIAMFHVVVVASNMMQEDLRRIDDLCRVNGAKFIYGWTSGLVASVFCDFGVKHTVTDADGEPTRISVVQSISKTGIVTVAGNRHRLDDGDHVKFDELEGELKGMNSITTPDQTPTNVFSIKRMFGNSKSADEKVRSILLADQFQLVDFPPMVEDYSGPGMVSQLKLPLTLKYRSFAESCIDPVTPDQLMGLPHMDMNKLLVNNRAAQLHFGRLALWRFQSCNNGEVPGLHDLEDAQQCVQFANDILTEHKAMKEPSIVVDSIDQDTVIAMSLYARTELPGFCAFLGGMLAQECVKAAGKYMPLDQWLHHDSLELLQSMNVPAPDCSLVGVAPSRYDHQIAIFGRAFQQKLFDQVWFLVGAGALGCEYIKSIALIGLGCGPKGCIHVTDMDRIEARTAHRQLMA